MAASAPLPSERRLLAPVSHFVVVLVILAGVTLVNFLLFLAANRAAKPAEPTVPIESQSMARTLIISTCGEWAILFYVWAGVRSHGGRLRDLTGGRWSDWKQVA